MHKIIFFPENLKKILGFTSKFFRYGRVNLNTGIFLFGLNHISVLIGLLLFQIFETNVKASFFLCKEVVPHMEARG